MSRCSSAISAPPQAGEEPARNGRNPALRANHARYDIENRLWSAPAGTGWEGYWYSFRNERIRKGNTYVMYDLDGQVVGEYQRVFFGVNYGFSVEDPAKRRVYFGGRLIRIGTDNIVTDRLGSVVRRGSTNYRYYPYGEQIGTPALTDSPAFAAYTRDASTGNDYALNRYYQRNNGRFTTADPYQASGGAEDPSGWNRYSYVGGDPVNYNDPRGLARCRVVTVVNYFALGVEAEVLCYSEGGTIYEQTWMRVPTPNAQDIQKAAEESLGKELDEAELWSLLFDTYSSAQEFLTGNENCIGLFGTPETRANGWHPHNVLAKIFFGTGGLGRTGYSENILNAPAAARPVLIRTGSFSFAIGAEVSFDTSQWRSTTYAGDHATRGLVFLHELGHAYNILALRGSGGSPILDFDWSSGRQDFNNTLVWTNCYVVPPTRP